MRISVPNISSNEFEGKHPVTVVLVHEYPDTLERMFAAPLRGGYSFECLDNSAADTTDIRSPGDRNEGRRP